MGFTDDDKSDDNGLLNNVQFMLIGAILGVIATVIYY